MMIKTERARGISRAALLIALPIIFALASLMIGRVWVSPADVFASIGAKLGLCAAPGTNVEQVLYSMRLPRILLSLLVGAGLSTAGVAFQSLFANPLATPDTLGVASGASFGAALGILAGFDLIGIQALSLASGALSVTLTYLSGAGKGRGLNSFVLAGIMIGSLFTALLSLVKYTADTEAVLPAITYFLMGSLGGRSYSQLALGAPLIILGILVLYLIRWRLNVLPLSEDEAKATGVNLKRLRAVTVIAATAIVASSVSMCGQVGWVGLLVPHMVRMREGSNHLSLVPASISIGACFMVAVDTLARSVSPAEIPVSILTAIIGAPFFIFLMRKSGGWRL